MTKTILIDGETFQVRYNLFSALQTIRGICKKCLWWIDAICIDQKNTSELNEQVRNMKEIYANSSGTLVWLGPPDEMTEIAFLHLNSLSQSWKRRPPHLKQRRTPLPYEDVEDYRRIFHSECSKDDPIQPWRAIQFVACRSWFERAWVMQEVCVAPNVRLMCGKHMIEWVTLPHTFFVITQHLKMLSLCIDVGSNGRREIFSALSGVSNHLARI